MNIKQPTSGQSAAFKLLTEARIPIVKGLGGDAIFSTFSDQKVPIIAIWDESEMAELDEARMIIAAARKRMKDRYGIDEPKELAIAGEATVILLKKNGMWGYRRTTWTMGPLFWPPEGTTLEEVFEHAYR